jgi:hypothetical protein
MKIKVLILKGKHNDSIMNVTTNSLMKGACLNIIEEHLKMHYYYEKDQKLAEKIVTDKDGKTAYRFVMERSENGHEYEQIEIETLEEYEI